MLTTASHSATITITDRSTLQVAPEAFFFEVSLSGFDSTGPGGGEVYDDRLHEVYYYWDFYAAGSDSDESYTYANLTKAPSQFRNSRYGYGPFGSHTYRVPGTYRVSCTVVEPASGKSAIATLDVTVGDPDTVFTAYNQTIIVDSTGTGLAAYPNATVETSLDAAVATIKGYSSQSTPRRVILRRGQTFSTSGFGINKGGVWPSVHWLAADEAGTNPVINLSGSIGWNHTDPQTIDKDSVWQNLKFIGAWDPQTEAGTGGSSNTCFVFNSGPPKQFLTDGVTIQDFGDKALNTTITNTTNHPYRIFLNDSHLDGWRYFGIYLASAVTVALTGTKLEQDPLANAGGPKDGVHNNHGPFRLSDADSNTKVAIHSNEFFSRNDWLASFGIFGQQPCFRYDTAGIGGSALSMHGNVFEGGNNIMSFGVESGTSNKRINAIIAQNYLLASHATRICVLLNKAGMTFRNNIVVVPDTPQYTNYDAHTFIKAKWDGWTAGEGDEPIRAYNNTLINLTSSALTAWNVDGTFTDAAASNNLVYEPNLGTPNIADGPLDTTSLFTPSELGYKDKLTALQTAYATPASSVYSGIPQIGSNALGDALTGMVAYDDFYGKQRPQYPSRGALEIS